MTVPPHLPSHLQVIWIEAFLEGQKCGEANGLMELNPYELWEPLYEAWHAGWLEGIIEAPPRKYTIKDFRKEHESQVSRLRRLRLRVSN